MLEELKKIKDLFIDLKIPREERCKVPIIADEQGILQIGEYKSSENYKIDEKTKEVLKVTLRNYRIKTTYERRASF